MMGVTVKKPYSLTEPLPISAFLRRQSRLLPTSMMLNIFLFFFGKHLRNAPF